MSERIILAAEPDIRVLIPKLTNNAGISEPWMQFKDDYMHMCTAEYRIEIKLLDRATSAGMGCTSWSYDKLRNFAARLANPRLVQSQDSTTKEI